GPHSSEPQPTCACSLAVKRLLAVEGFGLLGAVCCLFWGWRAVCSPSLKRRGALCGWRGLLLVVWLFCGVGVWGVHLCGCGAVTRGGFWGGRGSYKRDWAL